MLYTAIEIASRSCIPVFWVFFLIIGDLVYPMKGSPDTNSILYK
jgi:hypothetical protein